MTQLAHQSDKLVALAGIASIFETKFSIHASSGLWLELFLDELLWFCNSPIEGEAVRHNLAPSWAWTSLKDFPIVDGNTLYSSGAG